MPFTPERSATMDAERQNGKTNETNMQESISSPVALAVLISLVEIGPDLLDSKTELALQLESA